MASRHSRSPSPQHEPRKRGRIACISCRQAKVRCDLVSAPCSRCNKLQLECAVDPGFKRTNKRDKFDELEDNVQRLQRIVERQRADGQNELGFKSRNRHESEDATSNGSPGFSTQLSPSARNSLTENASMRQPRQITTVHDSRSRSLGDITVSFSEIENLFSIYFEQYHHFLPILDPDKTHAQYHEVSPLLFWTVLSIAMRTYQPDASLLQKLTPVLSVRLWTDIGSCGKLIGGMSGVDISEIQTLLLLATWPLPNLHLWSDRSMTMAGMALTSGMYMGLHRPGFDAEYSRQPPKLDGKLITQRSSIWVAAYCLNVSVAAENGHEALVPSKDWLINNVCSPSPTIYIPKELRHCAIVAKHTNDTFKFFTSRNDNPAAIAHEPSFFAHVALFEKNLSEVGDMYSLEMSLANKIRSQGSLLLLQTMYFLSDQTLEPSRQGALRAYATAINLLTILVSDDNTNSFLLHAPNVFVRIIVRAAFVILRILFSTHGSTVDRANGEILFNTAVFFLRQMSVKVKEKDQAARVADALKLIWKHMEGEPSFRNQPPALRIQSRLGASLLFDCLLHYRVAAYEAHRKRPGPAPSNPAQTATPISISSNPEPPGGDSINIAASEGWTTPSFESFLESDLSWIDSLIDAPFSTLGS